MEDKRFIGSNFNDFLEESKLLEECEAVAIKRVIVWRLQSYIESSKITKTELAKRMGTSRSFIHKLLYENNTSITLSTILRVGKVINKPVCFGFGKAMQYCFEHDQESNSRIQG